MIAKNKKSDLLNLIKDFFTKNKDVSIKPAK